MSFEAPRTEDLPSVIAGMQLGRDPNPVEVSHGRLVPGPEYASRELDILRAAAEDAEALPLFPLPTAQQLARIAINITRGCWELPAHPDLQNCARYGTLQVAGLQTNKTTSAHRTMYRVFYGPEAIPEGVFLDHLCENKTCCYPRHLEATTPATNTRRGRTASVAGQLLLDYPSIEV